MALRIELSPEAAEELSESFDWYLERSEAAAEGFLAEFDHALLVISESPEIWPEFEARTRRYVMDRYPFSIIFNVREESVFIHALCAPKPQAGLLAQQVRSGCSGRTTKRVNADVNPSSLRSAELRR